MGDITDLMTLLTKFIKICKDVIMFCFNFIISFQTFIIYSCIRLKLLLKKLLAEPLGDLLPNPSFIRNISAKKRRFSLMETVFLLKIIF